MGYTVPPEGYWKSFVEDDRAAAQAEEDAREEACDRHYPKPDPLCVACGERS